MIKRILLAAWVALAGPAYALEVTDVAGRTVNIDMPVSRFVLSEGRYIPLLALLRPQAPIEGLVGLMTPLGHTHPGLEEQLFRQHPDARDIPQFGRRGADSVSVERIIELQPQVAVFGLHDHGPGARNETVLRHLEAAGIAVIFVDFRIDPLNHTVRSIELLGQVFGAAARAGDYLSFYQSRVDAIKRRVATLTTRPRAFLQAHPGRFDCCFGMADGMLGPFIGIAGGENIADAVAPGPTAQHSLEFLIAEDPDVWIGTASGQVQEFEAGADPVALGAGMTPDMATQSLTRFLSQPGFSALRAVKAGRAHALWHNFYNSPFNVVALEAFAKWLHPQTFANIDPQRTLQSIFDRFLPFEIEGTYFSTVAPQD